MAAPHLNDPSSLRQAKREMRQAMLRLRAPFVDAGPLIDQMLICAELRPGERVAGIWPLPGEPDLRPLLYRLHEAGHAIVLPRTTPPGAPLSFHPWHPGCAMRAGRFGTWHPDTDPALAPPDLLLVPLLAFDLQGNRLGYGGGYYDRTMAALPRARAIGYGFSVQQVEAVPHGRFDLPLDVIVTERGRVPIER